MLTRTLLDQAPTPLALARHGRVVDCNPAFAQLLGPPDPKSARGEPLLAHVLPAARRPLLDHIRELDPRSPRTVRLKTTATDRHGARLTRALLLRRFRARRESMDVIACLPPDPIGEALAVRDDLGLQLPECLPRPVWIWTPLGLRLWRNAAAGEEDCLAVRVLGECYEPARGRRLSSPARCDVLQAALSTESGVCTIAPAGWNPSPVHLWVLSITDQQGHVQAIIAAGVDSSTTPDGCGAP